MTNATGFGAAVIATGLAWLLLIATVSKVSDRGTWFAFTARLVPPGWSRKIVRYGLPLAEAGIAVLLLGAPQAGLVAAAFLFGMLALGIMQTLPKVEGERCACLGSALSSPIGRGLAARNAFLSVLAFSGGAVGWLVPPAPPTRLELAVSVAAVAGLAGRHAQVRRRDRRRIQGPALLVFMAAGCPPCEALVPYLKAISSRRDGLAVRPIVVGGDEAQRLDLATRLGSAARIDEDGLFHRLSVPATPWGMLIDSDDRVVHSGSARTPQDLDGLSRPPGDASRRTGRSAVLSSVDRVVRSASPRKPHNLDGLPQLRGDASRTTRRSAVLAFAHVVALIVVAPGAAHGARRSGNVRDGTCREFVSYARRKGVTGSNGVSHKNWVGVTTSFVKKGWFELQYLVEPRDVWCSCNGATYSSIAACQDACRVSLACITGICQPVGQHCVQGKAKFGFVNSSYIESLKWRPRKRISPGCRRSRDRWEDDVQAHEEGHAADVADLIRSSGREREYRECAATMEEAMDAILTAALRDHDALLADLKARIEAKKVGYHTAVGNSTPIDFCGKCS